MDFLVTKFLDQGALSPTAHRTSSEKDGCICKLSGPRKVTVIPVYTTRSCLAYLAIMEKLRQLLKTP